MHQVGKPANFIDNPESCLQSYLPSFETSQLASSEVDWYVEHGATFLADTEYPALPGFKKSYVTYQPLGDMAHIRVTALGF